MYTISTYTNNTHKKMYQNNYTNIPEQYIDIIRNGPDESTVIRGRRASVGYLKILIKPKIVIGINIGKPETIYVAENSQFVISPSKITQSFGAKWIPTFQELFPGWLE